MSEEEIRVLFPEDVETITISKNDYDRLFGEVTLENIKLQQENAQLKEVILIDAKKEVALQEEITKLRQFNIDYENQLCKAINYFDSERFTDVFLHFTNAKDTIKRELKDILESNKED